MNKVVRFLCILLLAVSWAGAAAAAPVRITNSARYDRNPNFLKTKDGKCWLFYTRGRNPIGVRGVSGYDPDGDYYDIYYRLSGSVGGLKTAKEVLVPGSSSVTANTQRDIAVVQATDGTVWLFASSGYGYSSDSRILVYQYKKPTGWTGPTAIDNTTDAGHVDALAVSGVIWLFFDSWSYNLKVMFWNGSAWSTPAAISDKATLAKAIYVGGRFYLVWAYVDMDQNEYGKYIGLSTSTDGLAWSSVGQVAAWAGATNWDPVIVKFAGQSTYRIYFAPDGGSAGQFLALTKSKTPLAAGSWSTPVKLTTSSSGAASWWDFWPNPPAAPRCLFYSSERNDAGTGMTNSRIWMLWQ